MTAHLGGAMRVRRSCRSAIKTASAVAGAALVATAVLTAVGAAGAASSDGVPGVTATSITVVVLHETCHQWFGDMVTMRWFDDLWLKEGFAQYMAYKALEHLEPASNPWKHFYEDIKPLAYGIDETQGTTPIFQNIANLKDAKSAYGAIVYEKAPAVLKQLNYFLDEDNFRQGLRLYLKEHAYANAEWADLVHAFEVASDQAGHHQDVQTWAKSWITRRGMPEVTVNYSCHEGKITAFTINQRDVLDDAYIWPMANQILFISTVQPQAGQAAQTAIQTIKVQWNASAFPFNPPLARLAPISSSPMRGITATAASSLIRRASPSRLPFSTRTPHVSRIQPCSPPFPIRPPLFAARCCGERSGTMSTWPKHLRAATLNWR